MGVLVFGIVWINRKSHGFRCKAKFSPEFSPEFSYVERWHICQGLVWGYVELK